MSILASTSHRNLRRNPSDRLLSNVESLKKGIIKTSNSKASYTILLVGETGAGKSSVLELIANVVAGNDIDHYDFNILDHTNERPTNERDDSNNQSQTNSVRLYECKSKNGITVCSGVCKRDEYT
jgi:predicted ATP-binding protein involved in virulence